jgi:thiosulfate reductase cytochrome b subunit
LRLRDQLWLCVPRRPCHRNRGRESWTLRPWLGPGARAAAAAAETAGAESEAEAHDGELDQGRESSACPGYRRRRTQPDIEEGDPQQNETRHDQHAAEFGIASFDPDDAPWYHPRVSDPACVPSAASAVPTTTASRHSALVRVTHWITTLCFLALLVSGMEIVISHPRFYWGETGNVLTTPLFRLPIPSSRALVPTGYGYVLPDQNGWSRALHFQTAWVTVLTGMLYAISGLFTGHFRKDLLPRKSDLSFRSFSTVVASHLRFKRPGAAEAWSYNVLQRLTYLFVIFVLFPLVVWTGLAMSPAFVSAVPATVTVLGGRQTARTLHFIISLALLLFLLVHVVMVALAGFRSRTRAMITGQTGARTEGI